MVSIVSCCGCGCAESLPVWLRGICEGMRVLVGACAVVAGERTGIWEGTGRCLHVGF